MTAENGGVLVNPERAEGYVFLFGESLLSKWGFGDGDVINDWWWDTYDEPLPDQASHHDVLRRLVREHLIPAIEAAGHTIEVCDIETIHNPIRAEKVDASPIDDYRGDHGDLLADVWVAVSPEVVKATATSREVL